MSTVTADNNQFHLFRFIPIKRAGLLLALLGCIIYINTLGNKYALDDDLIVSKNRYVLQGFSGIDTILTTDMFDSYYREYNVNQNLSGGRYRPLCMVTFAIEHQFFGVAPAISHFINMLLYGLLVWLIFQVLLTAFRIPPDVVFLTTLLFAIHPLHTEVVANIKSRDEILSLGFIILTFKYALQYIDTSKMKYVLFAAITFLMAFLSKEYAYALIVLLPIAAHVFRPEYKKGNLFKAIGILIGVTIIYTYIRYSVVGMNVVEQEDVLNNPYVLATPVEAFATKIYVLLKYLTLLLFPAQMSADYSFKQIPYYNFGSPLVWLSIVVYGALIAIGLYGVYKKKVEGFAAAWYLGFLLPIANFAVGIGATMGERLVFHASLGFCLLLAIGIVALCKRFSVNYKVLATVLACIVVLAAGRTLARNYDWKDTNTLFVHDVNVVPNSAMANANASSYYIDLAGSLTDTVQKKELALKGRAYAKKAVETYPEFTNALINYGVAEYLLGNMDNALTQFMIARQYLPQSPHFKRIAQYFYDKGMTIGKSNVPEALYYLKVACKLDSVNAPAWVNLGGAYYTVQKFDSARYCWQIALTIDPQNNEAKQGYNAVAQMANNGSVIK